MPPAGELLQQGRATLNVGGGLVYDSTGTQAWFLISTDLDNAGRPTREITVFDDGRGYAWHQRNEKLED